MGGQGHVLQPRRCPRAGRRTGTRCRCAGGEASPARPRRARHRLAGHGDRALVGHLEPRDQVPHRRPPAAQWARSGPRTHGPLPPELAPGRRVPGAFSALKVLRTLRPRRIGRWGRRADWGPVRHRSGAVGDPVGDHRACAAPLTSRGSSEAAASGRPARRMWPGEQVSRPRRTAAAAGEIYRARPLACTPAVPATQERRGRLPGSTARGRTRTRAVPARPNGSFMSLPQRASPGRGDQARSAWSGCGERRAEDGHHRVADELHDRAALTEDGLVHRRPVRVRAGGPAGWDRRARRWTSTT